MEGHEPSPGRVTDYGHRRGIKGGRVDVRPGPHIPQRSARLGEPQVARPHPECGAGVGGALASAPGLEPGIAGAFLEERPERLLLVPQRLLERDRGYLVE